MNGRSIGALVLASLSLCVCGCERNSGSTGTSSDNNTTATTPSATDQSNAQRDLDTTAAIRRALMDDATLSTAAKNVTVITQQGAVTLKGTVPTQADKDAVAAKAKSVAGVASVDNQITVKPD